MPLSSKKTLAILGQQVYQQASMNAFLDAYWLIAILFLVMIPLVLLMKNVRLKELS